MNVEIHQENMSFYDPIKCTMYFNWKDEKFEKFVSNRVLIIELANSLRSCIVVICDVG